MSPIFPPGKWSTKLRDLDKDVYLLGELVGILDPLVSRGWLTRAEVAPIGRAWHRAQERFDAQLAAESAQQ